jgi:hypothetical protein
MSTLKLKPAFNKGVAMQEFEIQSMTCGHSASGYPPKPPEAGAIVWMPT